MIWRSWVQTPLRSNLVVLLSKSYLNQKYQLSVHQSICEPVHLKSPQTSKVIWQYISLRSLIALWLQQASQWHEMYCHDLEVMSLNPDRVKLGVRSTSVPIHTRTKDVKVSRKHLSYQKNVKWAWTLLYSMQAQSSVAIKYAQTKKSMGVLLMQID